MKKLFLIPAIAAGLLLASCKDNEPTPNPNGGKYDNYPYSALTPEQQKEKLAEESDAILQKVKGLQDAQAVELAESLYSRMGADDPSYNPDVPYNPNFYTSKQFRSNFWEADKVMIKDVYGTFTWDPAIEDWDYTDTPTDKLVILLPENLQSTQNNGRVEVSGTGSGQIVDDGYDQYEIPSSVQVKMFVNNAEVGSVNASAEDIHWDSEAFDNNEMNWQALASSATASVNIDDYAINVNASQQPGDKVSSTVSFTKGNDVIIKGSLGGAVDWDYTEEYCTNSRGDYDPETGDYTYECLEYGQDAYPMPEEVNAEVEIGSNLVVEGFVNAKALTTETDRIHEEYDIPNWTEETERAKAEEYVAAYNKYMRATLVSKNDRCKIATLKWGVTTYDRYDGICDESGCYEVPVGTGYTWEPFLVFGDNTEVTAETYFGSGFDKVIDSWEEFLSEFNFE